jgi:hypothetical protein
VAWAFRLAVGVPRPTTNGFDSGSWLGKNDHKPHREIRCERRCIDQARHLSYVLEMLRELRAISASAEAETLVYLMDMAILEAAECIAALRDDAA